MFGKKLLVNNFFNLTSFEWGFCWTIFLVIDIFVEDKEHVWHFAENKLVNKPNFQPPIPFKDVKEDQIAENLK